MILLLVDTGSSPTRVRGLVGPTLWLIALSLSFSLHDYERTKGRVQGWGRLRMHAVWMWEDDWARANRSHI